VNGLIQDVRYALRQLSKNPGFACTTILILALGIGATTAIFSTLNPILFEPLPYPNAGRIMTIWYAGEDGSRIPQAFHTFREVAERSRSFEALAVMKTWQPTLVAEDQPERLEGQRVSAGYFRVLGIAPVLGRDFQPSDDVFNGSKVAILSNGLWRRRFAGDRTIVGRNVKLDDNDFTVIGVVSGSFESVLAPSAEVWTPLQYNPGTVSSPDEREWGHHLRMVGRLRDSVGREQARSDLAWIAKTPVPEFPRPNFVSLSHGMIVDRLQDDVTRGIKPALLAVFGAVLLVLLIACVNVANLMLAQGAQRQGEVAMRAALGAARSRLVRQFVTESLLLFLMGGALGMLVAQAGIRVLVAMSPAGLPRVNAIRLDGAAFAFAFVVTMFIGLVVGMVPAWHASRGNLQNSLQQGSQRTTGTHQATRRMFVVAEVAVAVVLLVTGGLLLRSLRRLFAISPGFNASGMLTMQVQTYGHRYEDEAVRHQFFDQALDAVRRVPGVTAAAFTSQLPLSGDFDGYGAHFVGDNPEISYPVFRYAVTAGYFSAIDIPLLRGRVLGENDTTNTPPAIVISESLAKSRFPNEDPIGKRLYVGSQTGEPFTVVGVVGDVKQVSLGLNDSDAVYITNRQWHWPDRTLSLVVRMRGNASTYIPSIKNAIWSIDRELPVVRVAMMDDLLAASAAERHFAVILFEAFGLIALALAATGIYGVLSGSVTERTREIGVRSALGAPRRSILELILRQGMTLTGIGVLLGLAGSLAASRALAAMLFSVSSLDPLTYLGVSALLAAVSVIACSLPAWRAARIDPMVALRYE
jgi:putative ABC transport system permease protein